MWPRNLLISLASIVLLLVPVSILAQVPTWDFSVSAFGGGAFPFKTDYRIDDSLFPISGTISDVTIKNSLAFGGKLAAWTTALRSSTGLDVGVELDITHYDPNVSSARQQQQEFVTVAGPADIGATITAINLLLRYPLYVTAEFPQGRGHPYFGIGGGVEVARKKGAPAFDFSGMLFAPPGPMTIQAPTEVTDTAAVLQVLMGAKFFYTRHLALFGEYKFIHSSHTFQYPYVFCNGCGGFGGTPISATRTEHFSTNVNFVVGGLAVHF